MGRREGGDGSGLWEWGGGLALLCILCTLCFASLTFTRIHLHAFKLYTSLFTPFTSLHFPSLPFTSLHFPSLPFTSLHFPSLPFTSLCSSYKKNPIHSIHSLLTTAGAILETTTDLVVPTSQENDNNEDEDEEESETKVVKTLATFDKITVWGHGQVPETGDGGVVRSMEEWVEFAGRIHSWEDEE
jgi:hypothetical protein